MKAPLGFKANYPDWNIMAIVHEEQSVKLSLHDRFFCHKLILELKLQKAFVVVNQKRVDPLHYIYMK